MINNSYSSTGTPYTLLSTEDIEKDIDNVIAHAIDEIDREKNNEYNPHAYVYWAKNFLEQRHPGIFSSDEPLDETTFTIAQKVYRAIKDEVDARRFVGMPLPKSIAATLLPLKRLCSNASLADRLELARKNIFQKEENTKYLIDHVRYCNLEVDVLSRLEPMYRCILLEQQAKEYADRIGAELFRSESALSQPACLTYPRSKSEPFPELRQKLNQIILQVSSSDFKSIKKKLTAIAKQFSLAATGDDDPRRLLFQAYCCCIEAHYALITSHTKGLKDDVDTWNNIYQKCFKEESSSIYLSRAHRLLSSFTCFLSLVSSVCYSATDDIPANELLSLTNERREYCSLFQDEDILALDTRVARNKKLVQELYIKGVHTLRALFTDLMSKEKLRRLRDRLLSEQHMQMYANAYSLFNRTPPPSSLPTPLKPKQYKSRIQKAFSCLTHTPIYENILARCPVPKQPTYEAQKPSIRHQKECRSPLQEVTNMFQEKCEISSLPTQPEEGIDIENSLSSTRISPPSSRVGQEHTEEKESENSVSPIPESIVYHPRVRRWFTRGGEVCRNDPSYIHLPQEEWETMAQRHAFSSIADSYLSLGATITWRSRREDCRLTLIRGKMRFNNGEELSGYFEYAFDLKTDECFHRYFSTQEDSIPHKLAQQQFVHLKARHEPVSENSLGEWNISGEQAKVTEKKECVLIDDTARGVLLTLYRP